MRKLIFQAHAKRDLKSILVYTGKILDRPKAAKNLYDSLCSTLETLSVMPELGKLHQSIRFPHKLYRRFLSGKYWIIYTYTDTELIVLRIYHVRQNIDVYDVLKIEQ